MKRNDLFPKAIQLAAQHSQRQTGVPACVTLAQWAVESAYGKAKIGPHNYFGIKWRRSCPYGFIIAQTREQVNGVLVPATAKFINFPTLDAAFAWHGELISDTRQTSPYRKAARALKRNPDDWKGFINLMAPVYATDSHYEDKLCAVIARFRLYELNLPAAPAS